MATSRSVVVNGDLGSGKSTVSILLAHMLGLRRISVGGLYRELARRRGMTALELNLHAELDDEIDHHVDQLQSEIARSGEAVVIDSRLAWFFFRDALKVHLITDPTVAAHRVFDRPANAVESYPSVAEAERRLAERSESERVRFIRRYGADKTRLRNYDLVCDSSRATPEEIVARIVDALQTPPAAGPRLLIDPRRIHSSAASGASDDAIRLGYARPHFFVVDGLRAVRAAIRDGLTLVSADLVAEADELIGPRSATAGSVPGNADRPFGAQPWPPPSLLVRGHTTTSTTSRATSGAPKNNPTSSGRTAKSPASTRKDPYAQGP